MYMPDFLNIKIEILAILTPLIYKAMLKVITSTLTQNFRIFHSSTLASLIVQYNHIKVVTCYYDTLIFFLFNEKKNTIPI